MTQWAKKLGLASAMVLALGISLPSAASAAPSFCRSGAGHPVHGREWCVQKGFGLGGRSYVHYDSYRHRTYDRHRSYDRYSPYRYDRYRPSWSYTPYYRSDYGYYGDRYRSPYGSRYGYPRYPRTRSSNGYWHWHQHDGNCRH